MQYIVVDVTVQLVQNFFLYYLTVHCMELLKHNSENHRLCNL